MTPKIGLLWVWVCTIVDAEASIHSRKCAATMMLYALATILQSLDALLIAVGFGDLLALFSFFCTYTAFCCIEDTVNLLNKFVRK
jgi:hypothetical protein